MALTYERMGIRAASTVKLFMKMLKVPKENLLGKEGQGFKIAMTALGGGRIGIAAQSVGIAQGAIDEALKYVKERKQFGKTIGKYQNTQFKLAECQTKVDAARLMVYGEQLQKKTTMDAYAPFGCDGKLFASEVANDVTRSCVQLFGGYGYYKRIPSRKSNA